MQDNSMLSISEAAKRLNVSVDTVRRRLTAGELKGHKFGRAWRIQVSDLNAYIHASSVSVITP